MLCGMATYDAQGTRRRLLDAACAEFARYGVAGARVDRIAETAGSNKAQIYHYFGSKTQLFDTVCEQAIQQMEAEVPFDPYDLPGYAARLVRLHERQPEIMRLCTWQRLERPVGEPSPAGVAYARAQIDAIAQAQKTGDLPAHFHPGFLLGLVLHLATGWVSVSPEFETAIDIPDPGERARHIEDAIRTLLSQGGRKGRCRPE
jgi:AcrR family transcriptional regulator